MKMQETLINRVNFQSSDQANTSRSGFDLAAALQESVSESSPSNALDMARHNLLKLKSLHMNSRSDLQLPISKSGQLEPVQVPHKPASDLI